MRRYAGALVLMIGLSGCLSVDRDIETGGGCPGNYGRGMPPPAVPGLQGPHGQAVPMIAPYSAAPPQGALAAQAMLARSVPLNMVQINRPIPPGVDPGIQQASFTGAPGGGAPTPLIPKDGILSPPGMPFAPGMPAGPMPGGPMPGQMMAGPVPPGGVPGMAGPVPPGALGSLAAAPVAPGIRFPTQRTQVRFLRPSGMKVSWFTVAADGKPAYSPVAIDVPGRYNFMQGAIYRLKLSNIEGLPGVEIYPTLEVVPANPRTETFLAHSSVPVVFTPEDFRQIAEGNYVVKVIYLPHPQYQELAGTGPEEILSTRLEPGANPITEALRRGDILLIIRMGNVDQEAPNTPPIGAPSATAPVVVPRPGMPVPGGPPLMVPYFGQPGQQMVPPGMMPPGMMPPGMMPPGMIPPGMMPPPGFGGPGARGPMPPAGNGFPPPGMAMPGPQGPMFGGPNPFAAPFGPGPVGGPGNVNIPGPNGPTPAQPAPAAPSVPTQEAPAAPTTRANPRPPSGGGVLPPGNGENSVQPASAPIPSAPPVPGQ